MFAVPFRAARLLAVAGCFLIGGAVLAQESAPAAKTGEQVPPPGGKSPTQQSRRRPAQVISILIETSHFDLEAREELQMIYDALRKLDKDNNGKIDPTELDAARKQLIEGRADAILKKLGKSKPGQISKDEAQGRIKEHFDQLDTNKDGVIDREELIQAMTRQTKAGAAAPPRKDPANPNR